MSIAAEDDLDRVIRVAEDARQSLWIAQQQRRTFVGREAASESDEQCPLVEAWNDMDLSADEKKKMCDFAYQVDFGKFEAAGYKLEFNCRIAEGQSTCDLHLTK